MRGECRERRPLPLCPLYSQSRIVVREMKNDFRPDETVRHRFFRAIHRKTAVFFRAVLFGPDNPMRKYSLLALVFFGLAGVLIDLDHLIIFQAQMVRPLHIPIWIGLCVGTVGYYAYLRRRVHQLGVKENNKV